MQIAGLNAIKTPASDNPLAEYESLRKFVEFLQTTPLVEASQSALVRTSAAKFSSTSAPLVHHPESLDDSNIVPFVEEQDCHLVPEPIKKKRGGHAQVRTAVLGADPRTKRAQLRSSMLQGFYLFFSGKEDPHASPVGFLICVAGY